MKKWNVDRVTVFLFIAVVSFLYDLTFYLGIRDTTRFPHPFVYFRSLGDLEYLRGFPGMLRQAMFSLVAGGLIGWASSLVILKNDWLTGATIRFLRIAMWFPFLLAFAVHDTFWLGISATMLAAVYHYLTARLCLDFSNKDAFPYAVGETALQSLFFALLGQAWTTGWAWLSFGANFDAKMGYVVLTLVLTLVFVVNFVFRRSFLAGCERRLILSNWDSHISGANSLLGVVMLTIGWLVLWQITCMGLGYDSLLLVPAIQKVGELLVAHNTWNEILISLAEVGGGLVFGSLIAFVVTAVLSKSTEASNLVMKILPATYIAPVIVWVLVFFIVFPPGASSNWQWYRSFFLGVGHKMMGVGLLTFFPIIQACWALRKASVSRRGLIAIADALPVAFIAMCFGELYAATAGLGFQMVVESATFKFQESLAWFLITAIFLSALSAAVSLIVRHAGLNRAPAVAVDG